MRAHAHRQDQHDGARVTLRDYALAYWYIGSRWLGAFLLCVGRCLLKAIFVVTMGPTLLVGFLAEEVSYALSKRKHPPNEWP